MKKILSLIVLALMLVSILPVAAFAATDNKTYDANKNEAKEITFATQTGAQFITVPTGISIATSANITKSGNVYTVEAGSKLGKANLTASENGIYAIKIFNGTATETQMVFVNDLLVKNTTVETVTASAPVTNKTTDDKDGIEYDVQYVRSATSTDASYAIVLADSAFTAAFVSTNDGDDWTKLTKISDGFYVYKIEFGANDIEENVRYKFLSATKGNVNILFAAPELGEYTYNDWKYRDSDLSKKIDKYVIGGKAYTGSFAASTENSITFTAESGSKYANGVDTYKLTATVKDVTGYSVKGATVSFTITDGDGTLSVKEATTNASGVATVKVSSTKPGSVTVKAKVGDKDASTSVSFKASGVTIIKAESDDNQKIARNGQEESFKYSFYDSLGNKVELSSPTNSVEVSSGSVKVYNGLVKANKYLYFEATIDATKPTGGAFSFKEATFADGNLKLTFDTDDLKKDGDYAVKLYLNNGSAVTYNFAAKKVDTDDMTGITLSYKSSLIGKTANNKSAAPTVKAVYEGGYTTSYDKVKFQTSDASVATVANTGVVTAVDYGTVTITAIDTEKGYTATATMTVGKAASFLKIDDAKGTAGAGVTVTAQLVNADGESLGAGADPSNKKAYVTKSPEDAIYNIKEYKVEDFKDKGISTFVFTAYTEGTYELSYLIDNYSGKFTITVGKATSNNGNSEVVFMVGNAAYVVAGKTVKGQTTSFVENGRTFLGLRDIGNAIGAAVDWDQATQTATVTKNGKVVAATVGASEIVVDGTAVANDAPSKNIEGRVYLPFRAVFQAFGYEVSYEEGIIICK